jgi:hypothetical protein
MLRNVYQGSIQGLVIMLVCAAYFLSFYQVTLGSLV